MHLLSVTLGCNYYLYDLSGLFFLADGCRPKCIFKFYPLEVVPRHSEIHLQVGMNSRSTTLRG